MDKREAIEIMEWRKNCMECVVPDGDCDKCNEAFKIAIECITHTITQSNSI